MTREAFRSALRERGDHADLWLVAVEDLYETMFGGVGLQLRFVAAFWTRGEAYSLAYHRHEQTPRHHCYVFRLVADSEWAETDTPRVAELETVITTASDGREVSVKPSEVAALLESTVSDSR